MSPVVALARTDARTLRRDTLLAPLLLVPPLLMLAVRLVHEPLLDWLRASQGFDAEAYLPWALGALFLVQIPVLVGSAFGLLVLDERDDGTLTALQVTPLGAAGYLRYRVAAAAAVATLYVLAGTPLTGLLPLGATIRGVVAAAPAAALLAAAATLLLPALGSNKVEGLALMKGMSLPLLLPVASWFVPSPWRWAFAPLPTFWPLETLWASVAGRPAWPAAVAGTLYSGALLALLARRVAGGMQGGGSG